MTGMGLITRAPSPDFSPAPAPLPYGAVRPLRASAQTISLASRDERDRFRRMQARTTGGSSWQSLAWDYYDEVGEVKYAFNLIGNIISRIRLYPAVPQDPTRAPDPLQDVSDLTPGLADTAARAMSRLASGNGGISAVLRDLAINLSVPGEAYLVQVPERVVSADDRTITRMPETWGIYSADALVITSGNDLRLKMTPDATENEMIALPPKAFVARIWRSHPRWAGMPDSSMLGLLSLLDELLLLNRTVRATARSRLNAGLLYLPDGLSTAPPTAAPFAEPDDLEPLSSEADDEDELEEQLIAAMTTPITDESSAAAVVPLIMRGPPELGEKIKYFQFERVFDPALAARADKVLDRVLAGLDVPKEIITGLQAVKYSNAVVIDDNFFRSNIEPLALLICDALTTVFLRPWLTAHGYTTEQAERVVLWYDPTDIVVRPNRNEDATAGYDRYALSAKAWRRINGFSETDAPDPNEILRRLVMEKGQIPDALTESLLRVIAPLMMSEAQAANPQVDANLPPEVQQALGMPPSSAPAPGPEAPAPAPAP